MIFLLQVLIFLPGIKWVFEMPFTVSVDQATSIISVKYIGGVELKDRLEATEYVCCLNKIGYSGMLLRLQPVVATL